MKVFVDTSAWLATEIKNDQYHNKAVAYRDELEKKRAQVFTNDYILDETYTRLIYDSGLNTALNFNRKIDEGLANYNLTLLEVDNSTRKKAWKELERFKDHKLSFTDATIIVCFKEYGLDEVFTFDEEFAKINIPTNFKEDSPRHVLQ